MSKARLFLFLLMVAAAECWAQSATTTTVSLSSGSVAWPNAVTLTVAVKAGANAVTPGVVKFCNAAATSSATATLSGVTISGSGNQSIEAKYPGSMVDAASQSSTLSLPPL